MDQVNHFISLQIFLMYRLKIHLPCIEDAIYGIPFAIRL